ncbi:MAG TPA: MFS transporter [Actinokineospora sp.]|nr:MFS transporter [Actinokineospora sp.]
MSRVPLVALLGANALSVCGTTMTFLAVPWFVLQTTGSPARTGLVAGVEVTGAVIAALFGGPVIDRVGRRRSSVVSDLAAAVVVAAIPALFAMDALPFGVLLGLAGLLGLTRAPGETARSAMMASLIASSGVSAERASSAYDGVSRGARMVGAPLAGVLIALMGPQQVLLVDAGTFLVSALVIGLLVPEAGLAEPAEGGYRERMRRGFAYLRGDRLMLAIMVMVMVTNMLDAALGLVLIPVYANDILHSSVALGLIGGVFGGCAMAGTIIYAWVGVRLPRRIAYTVAFLAVGAPRYFVMAAEPGLTVILVTMAVSGLLCGAINPILGVVEYERIPDGVRAMVLGVITAAVLVGAPVGAVVAGVAVEVAGLGPTLVVAGLIYLTATICPAVFPVWREMDAQPELVSR